VRRAARVIVAQPGVNHVTLGVKYVNGLPTDDFALKVFVEEKRDVPSDEMIPSLIEMRNRRGDIIDVIKTDVIEMGGKPAPFSTCSGNRILAFDNDVGIVTFAFQKGANQYLLTNAHVAADVSQNELSGPMRRWDEASQQWVKLGNVIRLSPLNSGKVARADLAVILVDDPAGIGDAEILGIANKVDRIDILRSDSGPHWFVANGAFACASPEPILTQVNVVVDGVTIAYDGVWQALMTQGQSHPGISGALLCRYSGGHTVACGQIFGGIAPNYIWAFPFKPIIDTLWPTLPG